MLNIDLVHYLYFTIWEDYVCLFIMFISLLYYIMQVFGNCFYIHDKTARIVANKTEQPTNTFVQKLNLPSHFIIYYIVICLY